MSCFVGGGFDFIVCLVSAFIFCFLHVVSFMKAAMTYFLPNSLFYDFIYSLKILCDIFWTYSFFSPNIFQFFSNHSTFYYFSFLKNTYVDVNTVIFLNIDKEPSQYEYSYLLICMFSWITTKITNWCAFHLWRLCLQLPAYTYIWDIKNINIHLWI